MRLYRPCVSLLNPHTCVRAGEVIHLPCRDSVCRTLSFQWGTRRAIELRRANSCKASP